MVDWKTSLLGKTNWKVGGLGLASSYGADERWVELAYAMSGVSSLGMGRDHHGLKGDTDEFQ